MSYQRKLRHPYKSGIKTAIKNIGKPNAYQ